MAVEVAACKAACVAMGKVAIALTACAWLAACGGGDDAPGDGAPAGAMADGANVRVGGLLSNSENGVVEVLGGHLAVQELSVAQGIDGEAVGVARDLVLELGVAPAESVELALPPAGSYDRVIVRIGPVDDQPGLEVDYRLEDAAVEESPYRARYVGGEASADLLLGLPLEVGGPGEGRLVLEVDLLQLFFYLRPISDADAERVYTIEAGDGCEQQLQQNLAASVRLVFEPDHPG